MSDNAFLFWLILDSESLLDITDCCNKDSTWPFLSLTKLCLSWAYAGFVLEAKLFDSVDKTGPSMGNFSIPPEAWDLESFEGDNTIGLMSLSACTMSHKSLFKRSTDLIVSYEKFLKPFAWASRRSFKWLSLACKSFTPWKWGRSDTLDETILGF